MSNVLSDEKRLAVLAALVDGNSERAVERMTDVDRKTVRRLAIQFGEGAIRVHNRIARNLSCSLIQCDEIWSFVKKKQARVTTQENDDGLGEAYTFVALDQSSRFAISWYVGKRNEESAKAFMEDVRSRLVVMPAMTSDGFAPYVNAVGASFGKSIDYAQTIKNYGAKGRRDDDYRYEPPRLKGNDGSGFITKKAVFGAPNLDKASTSYIERQNGTMRHHIGRIRRLCLAFSKKLDNHKFAVALGYLHYNMCLVVKTIRVTPAMVVGATDHIWDLRELLDALMTAEPCDPPVKQPLAPRVPEATHRELPNGKGFLRVIDGGKGKSAEPAKPPTPPAPVRYATPNVDPEKHWNEQDVKVWKEREKRMDFFGDDSSDDNPNW